MKQALNLTVLFVLLSVAVIRSKSDDHIRKDDVLLDDKLLRNGRGQYPIAPVKNCTILQKELDVDWRNIRLPHEYDCTRFYECDDQKLIVKACADRYRTRYDPFTRRCEWNTKCKCIIYWEYLEIIGKGNVSISNDW